MESRTVHIAGGAYVGRPLLHARGGANKYSQHITRRKGAMQQGVMQAPPSVSHRTVLAVIESWATGQAGHVHEPQRASPAGSVMAAGRKGH